MGRAQTQAHVLPQDNPGMKGSLQGQGVCGGMLAVGSILLFELCFGVRVHLDTRVRI